MCQRIGKGGIAESEGPDSVPHPMTAPHPHPTIISLTRRQHERAITRGDYLATERDCYRTTAPQQRIISTTTNAAD